MKVFLDFEKVVLPCSYKASLFVTVTLEEVKRNNRTSYKITWKEEGEKDYVISTYSKKEAMETFAYFAISGEFSGQLVEIEQYVQTKKSIGFLESIRNTCRKARKSFVTEFQKAKETIFPKQSPVEHQTAGLFDFL